MEEQRPLALAEAPGVEGKKRPCARGKLLHETGGDSYHASLQGNERQCRTTDVALPGVELFGNIHLLLNTLLTTAN